MYFDEDCKQLLFRFQLTELHDIVDRTVTLEPIYDSQYEKSDSPIQLDMSDEENEFLIDRLSTANGLICDICKQVILTSLNIITKYFGEIHQIL